MLEVETKISSYEHHQTRQSMACIKAALHTHHSVLCYINIQLVKNLESLLEPALLLPLPGDVEGSPSSSRLSLLATNSLLLSPPVVVRSTHDKLSAGRLPRLVNFFLRLNLPLSLLLAEDRN